MFKSRKKQEDNTLLLGALEPDFPLLMDIEREVAAAEALMTAEGFTWNGDAWVATWVASAAQERPRWAR